MKFRVVGSLAVLGIVAFLYWWSESGKLGSSPGEGGRSAPSAVNSGPGGNAGSDQDAAFKQLKIN